MGRGVVVEAILGLYGDHEIEHGNYYLGLRV